MDSARNILFGSDRCIYLTTCRTGLPLFVLIPINSTDSTVTAHLVDFTGSREEKGEGRGEGFNHNFPLPLGTEGGAYCGELEKGAEVIDEFNPAYLIVRYEHYVIWVMSCLR